MENVNDILKRQLLLMKFDSGVTLKENYEKVSGKKLLREFFEEADKVKNIVSGCYSRDNNKGLLINNTKMYETYADKYKDAFQWGYVGGTNCELIRELNDFISTNMSYSDLCTLIFTYDGRHHKDGAGEGFYGDLDSDINVDYGECGWSKIAQAFQNAVDKQAFAEKATAPVPAPVVATPAPVETTPVEVGNTVPPPSGIGAAKQGWDMAKVKAKYACLNDSDFAETQVMNDTYGDLVKLNLGKNRRGNPIYGKMYVQDGYIQLWDSPYTRIGNSDQYMACINNELSFQSGQNLTLTNPETRGPQMESTNKIGKLIREAINLDVKTSAETIAGDGNNGGDNAQNPKTPGDGNKPKPRQKGSNNTVCINKVQNLLKELNPAFNVSGSMDNNTLIEIMNKLNELEKSLTVTKDEVAVIEKPKYFPSIDITEP